MEKSGKKSIMNTHVSVTQIHNELFFSFPLSHQSSLLYAFKSKLQLSVYLTLLRLRHACHFLELGACCWFFLGRVKFICSEMQKS